jgi:hypothetical protein
MTLLLSNPANQAHLEDLRGRLAAQLAYRSVDDGTKQLLVDRMVEVVRAMDKGQITTRDALDTFKLVGIPGFSFGKWLIEMVDEDIYLDAVFDEAA